MKLVFSGDFALGQNSDGFNAILSSGKQSFSPIIDLLGSDIYLITNLEGAITTSTDGRPYKWVNLRMDPKIMGFMKSVNLVSLSNNHSGDYGSKGIRDTISTLRAHGLSNVGFGESLTKAINPHIVESNACKVAVSCLCCPTTNSEFIATHASEGVAPISMQSIKEAVMISKSRADLCILYLHWGCERVHDPAPDQLRLARHAIDCGADAVIGCHSHTIQSFEQYKDKWIFYGLGNYCFSRGDAQAAKLDGSFSRVPLILKPEHTESLVVSFDVKREGGKSKLVLDKIQPFVFDVSFLPRPCGIDHLTVDLAAVNKRLENFVKANNSFLSQRHEIEYRSLIRNGIMAYWYQNESIVGHSPYPSVNNGLMSAKGFLRRLHRVSRESLRNWASMRK